jgi:hypothetical protein
MQLVVLSTATRGTKQAGQHGYLYCSFHVHQVFCAVSTPAVCFSLFKLNFMYTIHGEIVGNRFI